MTYTREEILSISSGKELDQYVHEYIKYKLGKIPTELAGYEVCGCPAYSTDLETVFRALESLKHDSPVCGIYPTSDGYNVSYDFDREIIQAETLPEGICKAILLSDLREGVV